MFRFQRSRLVSSIGADEAMPALETRMSSPPNSTAVAAKARGDGGLGGHVHLDRPHHVRRVPGRRGSPRSPRAPPASMSASMTQAPSAR